ncbi:MAG TPA: adenylosuccinate synthetase [Saprospiraceae bacterium]|nr:adenylosuccinate synthetase [Saprospiraceae bacterium]
MKSNIVLGLGYGDEGKGKTTAWLAEQSKTPLVIRFSAGHQAGHTVVDPRGRRHVFSNFGAGTLSDAATYWSAYCTFNPIAYQNECRALKDLSITPRAYIDARAMVTTPYDIYFNRQRESIKRHGSCGLGVGATMTRNQGPYKLFVQDLRYPVVVEQKLQAIRHYYQQQSARGEDWLPIADQAVIDFLQAITHIREDLQIVQEPLFFSDLSAYDQLIFEGTQGILLDMDHGFFPYVTYAYTTSRNAMELIHQYQLPSPTIYYITRAYQTRHGNGFLSNEHLAVDYHPNPTETNQYNPWQGEQRVAPLDLDLLNYALQCDQNYSANARARKLVVTCLDQLTGDLKATQGGQLDTYSSVVAVAKKLETRFLTIGESRTEGLEIDWIPFEAAPTRLAAVGGGTVHF